jgi:hypothetical protein
MMEQQMSKTPKKIIVIRHAEKPIREGDQKLSSLGMKRAQDWARYIPHNFGTPDTIYATAATSESVRPIMTVMPLFEELESAKLNILWKDDEAEEVGEKVATRWCKDQIVLVCWHHGKIPNLLKGIGITQHEYLNPWPEDDFDTALVVTFEKDEPIVTKFKM